MVPGSNPNGGNLKDSRQDQGQHGKFFVFFCALILSPLLGIPEKAGVT